MHNQLHASHAPRNLLLSSLPPAERNRLLPHLRPVMFRLGEIVYEAGECIDYCYFPTDFVASLLYTTQDGATAEVGMVGKEGVLGVALFLGGGATCSRALTAAAGDGFKLPAKLLREEFAHRGPLHHLLLRYTYAFMTQISQTAVCNRLHSAEQRLCRWLLLCQDRKNHSELFMTHDLLANMLGVRRESVTVAAGHLQDAGLIHYWRGRIYILDRSGIESTACECYRVVEDEFDRLFGRERTTQSCHAGVVFEGVGREEALSGLDSRDRLA